MVGRETGELPREPHFKVDSVLALLKAAKLGLGIAELPNVGSITNGELVQVLPSVHSEQAPLHYICEKDREITPLIGELYKHLSSY